jgi:hypothetical protein
LSSKWARVPGWRQPAFQRPVDENRRSFGRPGAATGGHSRDHSRDPGCSCAPKLLAPKTCVRRTRAEDYKSETPLNGLFVERVTRVLSFSSQCPVVRAP